jgi:hypothetical protein
LKVTVVWDVSPVFWQKLTGVSEVLTASIIRALIALMIEAVSTSQTPVISIRLHG